MPNNHLQKQVLGFLSTPPLWKRSQFSIEQFELPEINVSDLTPRPIPQNIRLGHQMEHIFKQVLNHTARYQVLVHNIPVKKENRTIGEIDFILKDLQSSKNIHVELTYKFYIIDPEISEPVHQLMGPNKRDMFFTKMEKMKNHQFPLLHSHEGAQALRELNIVPHDIQHQTCFKAQLFKRYGSVNHHIRPLNKACICGFWLRFDTFNSTAFQSYRFYIPYKSEWVIAPHEEVPWMSHFDTLMELNIRMLKENAPMVWMKKKNATLEKFFVVWW
ncbi:DUF1853 family protein [Flavobacteriaceae bacterium TP-CH-4]|uniref:DUF1853 family protein n=1 Tax=Pelagihabitans pacificus TaxID=2696054 RepID=A0A967E7D7_9FLAO|nr:DUF1853 family protein [Pelagihabitans pacificus]NHF60139.1 DUF1853 family protein [Pelagihabitans pacificus]